MVGGLWRGLDHEDAARFAFLLATPVIFAAGVLTLPSLFGPAGETRTLTPFAVYCLIAGCASLIRFTAF